MDAPQTHDLRTFGLSDMIALGGSLRRVANGAGSMEEAARRVVEMLHSSIVDPRTGELDTVLVRLYRTIRFGELDSELQSFASAAVNAAPLSPQTLCLTLTASTGVHDRWRSPELSEGHRAIPLASPEIVERMPMVAQLIRQFGLDVRDVVAGPSPILLEPERSAFGVFHVEEADGSPYIPAQDDFVRPYGVTSVLGFGGMLPGPDLFAVVLFARAPIPRTTALLFQTIALSVKLALLPYVSHSARTAPEEDALPR